MSQLAQQTLWDVPPSESVTIAALEETILPKQTTRLRDLGFYESSRITCLKRLPFGGPIVLQIGDNIFSLTKDLAVKIQVEKTE